MASVSPRTGKALLDGTRPFASDSALRSWFHVATTLAALATALTLAVAAPWWPLRGLGSLLAALVLLRVFILYHDHMHGSLLRRSPTASGLFNLLGVLMLSPPRVWTDTHNSHHANTARVGGAAVGTYALWTVARWRQATRSQRLLYRLERHPLNMLFGHVTVFFFGLCALPFFRRPIRYASSGLAAVTHLALAALLIWTCGFVVFLFGMLLPFFFACAMGSYLFYVQHNADGLEHADDDSWQHDRSALAGSSYLWTDPLTRWFIGNIGYHHVHHLNVRIPFYRLPEAMAAMVELQDPAVTTLHPRDVVRALRLALWDPERGRMVTFSEAKATSA